jgi:hypothetical protein
MSYTKGELASSALEEIGIAEYEFDISPEQRQSVIRRMDMMMAEWAAKNILLAYPLTKSQTPDPDEEANIPDWAGEAVVTNLAIRIAPSYGKNVSMDTKAVAKNAWNTICGVFSSPTEQQFPSMPKGAGYKTTEYNFTPEPGDPYVKQVNEDIDLTGVPDGT